jgi:hypothetical protein
MNFEKNHVLSKKSLQKTQRNGLSLRFEIELKVKLLLKYLICIKNQSK